MNHTQRHLLFAAAWLYGLPLIFVPLFMLDAFPRGELHQTIWSVIWGLGLVVVFASWALRDVAVQGKSVYLAVAFTAAWFIVFFLAAIPYFFATRGLRRGAISTLRYLGFVGACFGGWMLVAILLRLASS